MLGFETDQSRAASGICYGLSSQGGGEGEFCARLQGWEGEFAQFGVARGGEEKGCFTSPCETVTFTSADYLALLLLISKKKEPGGRSFSGLSKSIVSYNEQGTVFCSSCVAST